MPNHVTVECPICHEELGATLILINDSEGDGPYMHHFTAIDDYTIDWDGHELCKEHINQEPGYETMEELNATVIQAGFNLIEAGDVYDIDPY